MKGSKSFRIASGELYWAVFGFFKFESNISKNSLMKDEQLHDNIMEYISKSKGILEKIEVKLQGILNSKREVVIWGTGQLALKLLVDTIMKNLNIKAFVDSSPINQNQILLGKRIMSPEEVAGIIKENDVILITSIIYETEISERIKTHYKLDVDTIGFKDCLKY